MDLWNKHTINYNEKQEIRALKNCLKSLYSTFFLRGKLETYQQAVSF